MTRTKKQRCRNRFTTVIKTKSTMKHKSRANQKSLLKLMTLIKAKAEGRIIATRVLNNSKTLTTSAAAHDPSINYR